MNNHKKHEMVPAMGSMTGNDAGDGNAITADPTRPFLARKPRACP